MRKYIYMVMSAIVMMTSAVSCEQEFRSSNELGVNDTRLNISTTDEGTFTLTVYSGYSWTMTVTQGEDWLSPGTFSCEGIGYVQFTYTANADTKARVAKVLLKASTGKEIIVSVVQNGMIQKASELSELEIL